MLLQYITYLGSGIEVTLEVDISTGSLGLLGHCTALYFLMLVR